MGAEEGAHQADVEPGGVRSLNAAGDIPREIRDGRGEKERHRSARKQQQPPVHSPHDRIVVCIATGGPLQGREPDQKAQRERADHRHDADKREPARNRSLARLQSENRLRLRHDRRRYLRRVHRESK